MLSNMVVKLTKDQAGSLGGRKKWSKIKAKRRSEIMRAVALARWSKPKASDLFD